MDRSQVVASPLLPLCRAAILLVLVGAAVIPAHSQNAARKQPVPAPEARAKAEKLIKDLFKDDFAKKKPADMLALSAKLLEQAKETKDDAAARYVLYREARDLAAQAGDASLALKVVNDLATEFDVNGPVLKAEALAVVAGGTTSPADAKALVETTLQVVEEALADDNFEAADKLLKVASTAATKAKSVPLVSAVQTRANDVEAIQKEYEAVKVALDKLAKNPKDADASGVAGRYLCLVKADWDKGLPMVAAGTDAKLKAPATKDLAAPKEATTQVEVGDAWWDLGETEKGRAKSNLQKRAGYWYRQALPNLAGLTKTRVEKRVALLGTDPSDNRKTIVFREVKDPGTLGAAKKAGDWVIKNGKLAAGGENVLWFNEPVAESFSVKMTCTSGPTWQAIALGPDAVYGKGEFVIIDVNPGGGIGATLSYSRPLSAAATLKPGKHVIEAKVSKGTLVVDVDGKETLRCKLDKDIPVFRRVGIYTNSGNLDVESVSFGPLLTEKK